MQDPIPFITTVDRRTFLRTAGRGAATMSLAIGAGALIATGRSHDEPVWQIDPGACTECGKCATHCVLYPSAVKAVHAFGLCGFCDYCTGYYAPDAISPKETAEGAENLICPTDAVRRSYVTGPYFEYHIDEPHCIGCAKCVDGCRTYGNGSLHLQVRHDLCVDCDSCSIDNACPSDAFRRVPASKPYMIKGEEASWLQ